MPPAIAPVMIAAPTAILTAQGSGTACGTTASTVVAIVSHSSGTKSVNARTAAVCTAR